MGYLIAALIGYGFGAYQPKWFPLVRNLVSSALALLKPKE